jgi:hypothetical protein
MRNEELEMKNGRNSFVSFLKLRGICVRLLLLSFLIFHFSLLISCESPFVAGLGPKADIRPPTIVLTSPEVDSFIRGTVTFTGYAEDDYRLDSVYIKISNYPDLPGNPWPDWTKVDVLKKQKSGEKYDWSATVDTVGFNPSSPVFPDGDFKIQLKAVDAARKQTETGDIMFHLKNMPPAVVLTLPSVTEGSKDGNVGGQKLNYGWAGDFPGTGPFPFSRILDTGSVLTGMISDNKGVVFEKAAAVAATAGDGGREKHPPQFRFWRVNPEPDNGAGGFVPGYYPDTGEVEWEDFAYEGTVDDPDSSLMEIGLNEYMFMHKIPNELDCYYGFEVRVQSMDGTEFYYPRDYHPPEWWESSAITQETKNENRYVLFYARLPQEYPTLDLYQFQNIHGENTNGRGLHADAWNSSLSQYDDIPGVDPAAYHPYVNSTAVFKNGTFVLRVKASHSRNVEQARVFWERSDKTAKGLFIWDTADKTPYAGWNANNNIPAGYPYEQWGYYDSHQIDTRNFIFTYHDDPAKDTLPSNGVHEFAAGRYKVQTYTGSEADWKNDKDPANWADYANPQGGKGLEEGAYDISGDTVYGSSYVSKYLCSITIDKEGPEIALNGIEGSPNESGSAVYTLNGVVKPSFRMLDSRSRDSGLRPGPSDYYKRANGRMGDELRYMLTGAGDKAKMDAYLNGAEWGGNPWPRLPDIIPGTPFETLYKTVFEIPYTDAGSGVTIYRNGPVLDGSCMFKVSKIYGDDVQEDILADGEYLLYAFARDNAFNVTWDSYPVIVDASSDIPGFEFIPAGAVDEFGDPGVAADYPNSADGNGFAVRAGDGSENRVVRNKFGANTTLRLRVNDDDSVDLGDERTGPAGNSGITVTVTGTSSDVAGNVTAYSDPAWIPQLYEMKLTEDDIISVFRGQPLDGENRRPVRERTGTINQFMLLEKLKGGHLPNAHPVHTDPSHPYNRLFGCEPGDDAVAILHKKNSYQGSSLPEGIYRITVTVNDYRPAKPRFPWDTDPVAAAVSKTIWIAVDSTGPAIERGSIRPPEGSYLPTDQVVLITGKVSDKHGPVTLKGFRADPPLINVSPSDLIFKNVTVTDMWEAEFEIPIHLNGNIGAFTFTFEFEDRFGNTNTPFPIKYSADNEPPAVGLNSMIRTFERDEPDVILRDPLNTAVSLPAANKLQLTNGVVSFEITASDNSGKVDGLRWWLLPATRGSVPSGLNYDGYVTDFDSYPFSTATVNKAVTYYFNGAGEAGAYGEADMSQRPYRFYIDTEKLHNNRDINNRGGDGEYRLHVIGIDAVGNVSRNADGKCVLQEVYVLQEQDRPYFYEFAPGAGDVVDRLVLTGTIYDDHGFVNGPAGLPADAVRIWFANSNITPTPASLLEGAPDYIYGYEGPVTVNAADLAVMGKNIGVKLNIADYFPGLTIENGPKNYVIEAADSRYTKFTEDGGPAGDTARRVRRRHYAFDYDNLNPVIVLTYPETGSIFGQNADPDFRLQGYIEDAYLAQSNGYYYIKYRIDDGPAGIWELRSTATGLGLEAGDRVNFNILAGRVIAAPAFGILDFANLAEGPHTLTLTVEDKSGKDASVLLSFTKDVTPPSFTFTNIDIERDVGSGIISNTNIGDWWVRPDGVPETAWYDRKRAWLETNPVSAIYYDNGVPVLTGTFTDEISDIDTPSIKYLFDNKGTGINWNTAAALTDIVIDGAGKSVRWTIYLTETGLPNGKPLSDGIHTIRFTVADMCGNVLYPNPATAAMYAFRIVSSALPSAKIITDDDDNPSTPLVRPAAGVTGGGYNVFGNASGFNTPTIFTVFGTASDAGLKDLRLKITDTSNKNAPPLLDTALAGSTDPAVDNLEWRYDTAGGTVSPPVRETLVWSYNITKTLYNDTTAYSGTKLSHGITYEVIATAVNWNGTESEEAVWAFTVDMTRPAVAFAGNLKTDPRELNPSQLHNYNAYEVLRSQNLRVQGNVTDAASNISVLEYKVWQWDYDNGLWKVLEPAADPYAGWTDMPGFAPDTSPEVNWTVPLSSSAAAPFRLAEGLYRIKVQARDSAYIRNPATPPRTDSGDFNPGGTGNPVTSDYMYFFYDLSGPGGFDPGVENYLSSRPYNGVVPFTGTATDPNRFKTVTVKVLEGPPGTPDNLSASWAPADETRGPATQAWELRLAMPFDGPNAVPDGRYRLEFTATDMAFNTTTVTRSFSLDNAPPAAEVTAPERRVTGGIPEASVTVPGGEKGVITGTTGDKSPNRSESGVAAVWYHLGYLNGEDIPYPDDFVLAGMTQAQRTAALRNVYLEYFNANKVWESVTGVGNADTGGNLNEAFDIAARDIDGSNAWFRYGPAAGKAPPFAEGTWPVPTGFIVNNINIYDWRMELPADYPADGPDQYFNNIYTYESPRGGFKQYANPIQVKGKGYNGFNGSNARMVVPVHELIAGQAGVYSLPLWVRAVDFAGNVSYACRDIWIYPDADIPATTINNPVTAGKTGARGGTISGDGVASNNTSIYSVIYRVKADNDETEIPDDDKTVFFTTDAVQILPYYSETPEYEKIPAGYKYADGNKTGWYRANLEVARGEPVAPWNFLINNNDEITKLIPDRGFKSDPGLAANDMIRVYLEVFVFSGSDSPIRSSINQGAGGTVANPKPYVRTFYLKEGAPQIKNVWIATPNGSSTYRDAQGVLRDAVYLPCTYKTDDNPVTYTGYAYFEPYRAGMVRGYSLVIMAELDAAPDQTLTQISIRRPDESNSGYRTAWQDGNTVLTGGVRAVPGVSFDPDGTSRRNHAITYRLDSWAVDPSPTGYSDQVKNGDWERTGGRYGVEIRIRNNSNPPGEASQLLEFGIDNFAPLDDTGHITPKKLAGTAVDFMGRNYDYSGSPAAPTEGLDMPRKIDRVYAWFTKQIGGEQHFVNFNTGETKPWYQDVWGYGPVYFKRTAEVTKNGDTVTNIDLTGTGEIGGLPNTNPDIGAYGIPRTPNEGTLDITTGYMKEISERTALPGSGLTWIPTNAWDVQWLIRVDTTKLPDGAITLNYLVFDAAGNASYYKQEGIYIRNRYPEIDRVTLYTDNNGIGAVYTAGSNNADNTASEEFRLRDGNGNLAYDNSRGYLNSGFISKNKFVGFKVETLFGSPDLNYRLQYVTRQLVPLTEANLQRMVDERNTGPNVYTVAEHGDYSNNNWAALGVNMNSPPAGTHFVFTPAALVDEMLRSDTAKVWRYTALQGRAAAPVPGTTNGNNNPVLPNEPANWQEPGHGFNFTGDAYFDVSGSNNRIKEFRGSRPDEESLNFEDETAFFLIKAWDNVNPSAGEGEQLYDIVVIGMNVYLTDSDNPVLRLYDLNPYTETAVSGNNVGTANQQSTVSNALDPRGIGENAKRGGLYNTGTNTNVSKSGHIEPRYATTALQPLVRLPGSAAYTPVAADGYYGGDGNLPATAINRLADNANNTWRDGTQVALDQVSGKVILRGTAWDDQLINEIRVRFGSEADGTDRAILRLDTNTRTLQPVNGAQAYARETLHWKTGHTVEWAYVWDAESRPNADGRPAANVPVIVTVVDRLGSNGAGLRSGSFTMANENSLYNAWSDTATYARGGTVRYNNVNYHCIVNSVRGGRPPSENTVAWARLFHNSLNVDIVPYVTGFERDSKFATKRSRQGWYSFYQGETGIKAKGFHLSTGGTEMQFQLGATTTTFAYRTAENKNSITFTIAPAGSDWPSVASGSITARTAVSVNGRNVAINHYTGHTTQSWNREYHYLTPGSELWINKPHAHVWRSTQSNAAPVTYIGNNTAAGGSWALQSPAMALEYFGNNPGRLTGVWSCYATAGYYYARNDNNARTAVYHDMGEPFGEVDISFVAGAFPTNAVMISVALNDGMPTLSMPTFLSDGSLSYDFVGPSNGMPTNSWQNPRVITTSGNGSYRHFSAYNAFYKRLYYGRVGTYAVLDGGLSPSSVGNNHNWGNITPSSDAGMYNAIEYDDIGPVVAYYDAINDTVRLAYASTVQPANATNWTKRYVLPESHALRRGSGNHISMKVDKNNIIHLAFYNSVYQTVVYAYGTRTGNFTAYTVDNVIKGGTWTDISVDDYGNPTIVYGDTGRNGTYDGMRMAYKSSTSVSGAIQYTGYLACPVTGANITGWEAVTVPANYMVNEDRLNVEVWPPNVRRTGTYGASPGWNAAVGYASRRNPGSDEGMFRLAYFYRPGYKGY